MAWTRVLAARASHRCRAVTVHHLRLNGYLLPVGQRQASYLDAQTRGSFHASRLLRFGDASDNSSAAGRDNHAVNHQRLLERCSEGVALLVAVRRQPLIGPDHRIGSRLDGQLGGTAGP